MLERRTFSLSDQTAFADLSGDDNPMHVDEVAARRLIFGGPVVHGVHAVCRALDRFLAMHEHPVRLGELNVVFLKPMRVGQSLEFLVEDESDSALKLRVTADGELATRIVCRIEAASLSSPAIPDEAAPLGDCHERSEYDGAFGSLPLLLPRGLATEQLPNLTRRLPHAQTALLLATTRLVGTECPGLHSIYSSLQLTFSDSDPPQTDVSAKTVLDWRVLAHDPRFGSLSIELNSPVGFGSIRAFVRPRPQEQPPFLELKPLVRPDEFAGVRALVVGGSRGFGEVCAKLLAAGGADVCITFHRGKDDAGRIAADIRDGGGLATIYEFDAGQVEASLLTLARRGWHPTHLFYFATPPIARATKNRFSPELFREFCSFYIDPVVKLVEELVPRGLIGLFYPSTVFVDELPANMGEYAAAKAAGETLCAFLEKSRAGFRAVAPRLPKSATDQTVSLVPAKNENPAAVLLETLSALLKPT